MLLNKVRRYGFFQNGLYHLENVYDVDEIINKYSRNVHKQNRVSKIFTDLSFKLKHFFPFFSDHGHSSFAILNGVEVKISEKFRPPEPVSKGSFLNLTYSPPEIIQKSFWFF